MFCTLPLVSLFARVICLGSFVIYLYLICHCELCKIENTTTETDSQAMPLQLSDPLKNTIMTDCWSISLSYLCLHFHRDKLPLPPIHHKSPSSLKSLTKNPHIACLWLMLLLCYCCQPASSLIMHKCLIKRWNNKGQNSENNINCESMPSDFQKDCKSNRWYRKLESS
jgi:hypothetical protein